MIYQKLPKWGSATAVVGARLPTALWGRVNSPIHAGEIFPESNKIWILIYNFQWLICAQQTEFRLVCQINRQSVIAIWFNKNQLFIFFILSIWLNKRKIQFGLIKQDSEKISLRVCKETFACLSVKSIYYSAEIYSM